MKTRNETQNQNHEKTSKRNQDAPERWRVLLNELRNLKCFFFFFFKRLTGDDVKWKRSVATGVAPPWPRGVNAQSTGRARTQRAAVVASLRDCG